jgi:hypothetical protein
MLGVDDSQFDPGLGKYAAQRRELMGNRLLPVQRSLVAENFAGTFARPSVKSKTLTSLSLLRADRAKFKAAANPAESGVPPPTRNDSSARRARTMLLDGGRSISADFPRIPTIATLSRLMYDCLSKLSTAALAWPMRCVAMLPEVSIAKIKSLPCL